MICIIMWLFFFFSCYDKIKWGCKQTGHATCKIKCITVLYVFKTGPKFLKNSYFQQHCLWQIINQQTITLHGNSEQIYVLFLSLTDSCQQFSQSLIFSTGSFTTKVWLKLVEVAPFGASISYKALSTAAGNSNAAQAVGQAMANNPIMLLVPCHRVIRSDGAFGNYAHGRRNSVKQWLLMFEKGEV